MTIERLEDYVIIINDEGDKEEILTKDEFDNMYKHM